jgi:hypothetical protein
MPSPMDDDGLDPSVLHKEGGLHLPPFISTGDRPRFQASLTHIAPAWYAKPSTLETHKPNSWHEAGTNQRERIAAASDHRGSKPAMSSQLETRLTRS